jgi:CRISPR-associated protein Cas2
MFVILVYDVNERKVSLINSICSKYLIWRQNSVFTGFITSSKLALLKEELREKIDIMEDHVMIFSFPSNVKFKLEEIGIKRYSDVNVLW